MEVIWGHILKSPRVIFKPFYPSLYPFYTSLTSSAWSSLVSIISKVGSNPIYSRISVSDTSRLSEPASESIVRVRTLAWNIILLSVFSSLSLFLFLSLIAFAIAIQYRLGAISYRWDKNIFRTLIVQCLGHISGYSRTYPKLNRKKKR